MYNLLMQGDAGHNEWEENQSRRYNITHITEHGRMFEHTTDAIKQQFTGNNGLPDFEVLKTLPCVFTYEGHDTVGSIGWISQIWVAGSEHHISYTLPSVYPKILINEPSVFEALGMRRGGAIEQNRIHWAVKDVDLFEVVTRLLYKQCASEGQER